MQGNCYVVGSLQRGSHGKELRETPINSQWEIGTLSPMISKEANPSHSHKSELESRSSLSHTLRMRPQPQTTAWLRPHERTWARDSQISGTWIPDSQELWDNTSLLFHAAKLGGSLLLGNRELIYSSGYLCLELKGEVKGGHICLGTISVWWHLKPWNWLILFK